MIGQENRNNFKNWSGRNTREREELFSSDLSSSVCVDKYNNYNCNNYKYIRGGSAGDGPPPPGSVDDLVIEGFSKTYSKVKGDQYMSIKNLGSAWQQPAGIWCSFNEGSADELVRAALEARFPLARPPSLPAWLSGAASYVSVTPVSELRALLCGGLALLKKWSGENRDSDRQWASGLHPDVARATTGLRPSVVSKIANCAGMSAAGLLGLFRTGFPVVGAFQAPGVFQCVDSSEPIGVDELLAEAPSLWEEVETFRAGMSDQARDDLWDECVKEASEGWLSGPAPIQCFDKSRTIPVRRFPVEQDGKIRYCDNLKRSGTNAASSIKSPVVLPCVDTLAQVASILSEKCSSIHFWKSDHRSAYKQLPAYPGHAKLCVIVAQSKDGSWHCFKSRTLLFGSSLAVLEYNLVSRFVSCAFSSTVSIVFWRFQRGKPR